MVTLLLMIHDITHNMRESNQGVMAIVECAVEMNTTAEKSSETTDEYLDIFKAQRNSVDTHDGRAGYHEQMFKNSMIKIMNESNTTTSEVDGDPVLNKKSRKHL